METNEFNELKTAKSSKGKIFNKKIFNLYMTPEEYDDLEELQTLINANTGRQLSKSEVLKLSVDVYLRILKVCEED